MAINQLTWFQMPDGNKYETRGLYYIAGTGTSAGTWLGSHPGITEYYDGLTIAYRIPIAGSSTTTLNINGLGAKTVYYNYNAKVRTQYPAKTVIILTYVTDTNYSGWHTCEYDTTEVTSLRPTCRYYNSSGNSLYGYKIVGVGSNGRIQPLTYESGTGTTKTVSKLGFRPNEFYFYNSNTTVSADGLVGSNTLYLAGSFSNLHYTLNGTGTAYREVYLCGIYDNSTGLFNLYHELMNDNYQDFYTLVPYNTSFTSLSSYFVSGRDYILLGRTNASNNSFYLYPNHPMYNFDGSHLILKGGGSTSATTNKNLTIGSKTYNGSSAVTVTLSDLGGISQSTANNLYASKTHNHNSSYAPISHTHTLSQISNYVPETTSGVLSLTDFTTQTITISPYSYAKFFITGNNLNNTSAIIHFYCDSSNTYLMQGEPLEEGDSIEVFNGGVICYRLSLGVATSFFTNNYNPSNVYITFSENNIASASNPIHISYHMVAPVVQNVTDLTGTSWIINNTPDFSDPMYEEGPKYYIDFSSNGETFDYIVLATDYIEYSGMSSNHVVYDGGWTGNSWKSISITGGDDATNPELINWFKANATLQ